MGHNVRILAEREASPGLDHDKAVTLEIMECVHFHLEDFRFVWTPEEFMKICEIFESAKKRYVQMGCPQSMNEMWSLCSIGIPGTRLYNNRFAIEIVDNHTIHFHNKSFRTQLAPADFRDMCLSMKEAELELCDFFREKIDITGPGILYHPVVLAHREVLSEYISSGETVPAEEIGELTYKIKFYTRSPKGDATTEDDLQRENGWLPIPCSGPIPSELEKRYLCALYESIKKWGYAGGPYYNCLQTAYKMPKGIYVRGSHRMACLLALGYKEIDVFLVPPPPGWQGSGQE